MRIFCILGSRDTEGRTSRAGGSFLDGFAESGWDHDSVFLTHMNIERCRQCDDDGWGECRQGTCVIDDDFDSVVGEISDSDAILFATPVYYSDLSESMRAFLDRLRRVARVSKEGVQGKPAFGICVAGGGGGGAPLCAARLTEILGKCGFDVLDMIPARRQNLEIKVTTLRKTGAWFGQELGS